MDEFFEVKKFLKMLNVIIVMNIKSYLLSVTVKWQLIVHLNVRQMIGDFMKQDA